MRKLQCLLGLTGLMPALAWAQEADYDWGNVAQRFIADIPIWFILGVGVIGVMGVAFILGGATAAVFVGKTRGQSAYGAVPHTWGGPTTSLIVGMLCVGLSLTLAVTRNQFFGTAAISTIAPVPSMSAQ